ncbi:MAG: hypothetical protein INF97_00800 [Roseomonas sp.]|nr:hypothetical protein [Roseomonas sp.]
MDFLFDQIIPAMIVLVGNLFGGPHGSRRWEIVTAAFGWTALVAVLLWGFFEVAAYLSTAIGMGIDLGDTARETARKYLLQTFGFALLSAITRDYEKTLFPFFNRKK